MDATETKAHRRFEIRRADGRSNSQVICDFIGDKEPGEVIDYKTLSAALSIGTDRVFDWRAVQAAARNAGPMLGRRWKRALQNVRGVGYRIAPADEHVVLAVARQDKAGRQLKRGFEILRDTRLEEIKDPESRRLHEGQLIVLSSLMHIAAAHEKRLNRIEAAINRATGEEVLERAIESRSGLA
jgi:hypothetical protein